MQLSETNLFSLINFDYRDVSGASITDNLIALAVIIVVVAALVFFISRLPKFLKLRKVSLQ